jgi:hypothetical protein
MTFFYICEGCDCGCVVITHGEPQQPDNTVCLFPGRLEGPNHEPVKPEWHAMRKVKIVEVKEEWK